MSGENNLPGPSNLYDMETIRDKVLFATRGDVAPTEADAKVTRYSPDIPDDEGEVSPRVSNECRDLYRHVFPYSKIAYDRYDRELRRNENEMLRKKLIAGNENEQLLSLPKCEDIVNVNREEQVGAIYHDEVEFIYANRKYLMEKELADVIGRKVKCRPILISLFKDLYCGGARDKYSSKTLKLSADVNVLAPDNARYYVDCGRSNVMARNAQKGEKRQRFTKPGMMIEPQEEYVSEATMFSNRSDEEFFKKLIKEVTEE